MGAIERCSNDQNGEAKGESEPRTEEANTSRQLGRGDEEGSEGEASRWWAGPAETS